jgi:hypothetical protein
MHPNTTFAADRRSTVQKFGLGLLMLAAVATLAVAVWQGLSSTTQSEGNAFESGSLSITDDNPNSSALFTVSNVEDGSTGAKCITVTNDGTIDYDALTVARSNGTGDLGEDVTFTVTKIAGPAVSTANGSCTAFDASTDTKTAVAIGGAAAAGQSTTAELASLDNPGDSVSYKIAYAVDMENDDQGQDVNGITFSWAASQG